MANYALKSQVLNEELDRKMRGLLKEHFFSEDKRSVEDKIEEFIDEHGYEKYRECLRLIDSFKHRQSRLWKYILGMIQSPYDVVFLTFTFTDPDLNESTFEDRRRWVRRFLHDQCEYYIANIDFGDKLKNPESKEREHYHAVAIGRVNKDAWESVHGWLFAEQVKSRKGKLTDAKVLAKYVTKLTNHAIKKSTGNYRAIYSRNLKDILKYIDMDAALADQEEYDKKNSK